MATFGDVSSAVTPDIGFPPGHGGKVVGNISVSVKTQASLLFNTQTGNCNCQTGPAPTLHLSREKKNLTFSNRWVACYTYCPQMYRNVTSLNGRVWQR